MPLHFAIRTCSSCKRKKFIVDHKKKAGLLATFFLVILPKCPFCLLSYSSTIMLCGKEETIISSLTYRSPLTIGITVACCIITLFSIFINYRDIRTRYAIALAFTGSILCMASTFYAGGATLYYSGVCLIFTGVWLNGSMLFIIRQLKNLWKKKQMWFNLSISDTTNKN